LSGDRKVLAGVLAGLSCVPWAGLWVSLVRFGVSVSKVENIFDFSSILVFDRHKYMCGPELYLPPMFNLASDGK
jgi:hypothetical protein